MFRAFHCTAIGSGYRPGIDGRDHFANRLSRSEASVSTSAGTEINVTTSPNSKRKGKSGQKRPAALNARFKADKLNAASKNEIKARLRLLNLRLAMLEAHTTRLANDLRQTGLHHPLNRAQPK